MIDGACSGGGIADTAGSGDQATAGPSTTGGWHGLGHPPPLQVQMAGCVSAPAMYRGSTAAAGNFEPSKPKTTPPDLATFPRPEETDRPSTSQPISPPCQPGEGQILRHQSAPFLLDHRQPTRRLPRARPIKPTSVRGPPHSAPIRGSNLPILRIGQVKRPSAACLTRPSALSWL